MPNSVNNTCLEASICRLQNTKIDSDSDFSRRCPDASWCCPNGELCNRLSKKCWFSFLNNVTSGRCCLSVRTVALQLHTIFIIRTRVLTVLPWRPDGCNSSPRLALSRIASERLQLSSHIYLCEWNLFTYRTLTGIRTVLPCLPDGCTWMLDSSGTLKRVRTCCCDVRMDASLNNSNLLNTDGHPDAWLYCPDGSLGSDFFWLGNCTDSSLNFEKHISEIKTLK